jgi:hypothetical protein
MRPLPDGTSLGDRWVDAGATARGVVVGVGKGVAVTVPVGAGIGFDVLTLARGVAVGAGVGGASGVTAFDSAEAGPVPAAFVAATLKV